MTHSGKPLDESHETIESRTARQVLVVVVIAFILWLCVQLKILLIDIIIAITLASAMAPLAQRGEEKKVPRVATVLLTYVVVGAFYAFAAYLLWRPIVEQSTLLAAHIPTYASKSLQWYDAQLFQHFGTHANLQVSENDLRNVGTMVFRRGLDVGSNVIAVLLNVVLVLFLAAYFVIHSKQIWTALLSWVPLRHRARIGSLVGPVGGRMGGYVRGQALVSTAVATFFAVGFSLIHLPYAIVLGLVAGILNLVPFVGSMIITVVAVMIAANQEPFPLMMILTFGLFALEQALESNFIVPFLLGYQVELDPLVVLLSILIGATLLGAVGALIAVPIASALLLIATELYKKPMHEQEAVLS